MPPDKFLGLEFFQTTNRKKIYAIVAPSSMGAPPSRPIVCLNTGMGCSWMDFHNTKIVKTSFELSKITDPITPNHPARFRSLSPGNLFFFCDRARENPQPAIRLFGSPMENNTDKMLSYGGNDCLALELVSRQLYFGIHAFYDFVADMMQWPVKIIETPIRKFVNTV